MDPEMVMQPGGIEWRASETPVDYPAAVEEMEKRVAAIRAGGAAELVGDDDVAVPATESH